MKLKNIICAMSIGILLFSQTSFATQVTQEDSTAAQTLPQSESAAAEEGVPNGQMPQDFGGRMPRKGGMGGPPGGMRRDGGEMPPDMQMPEQPDAQTDAAQTMQEQLPQTNESESSSEMPQDNMMRGQMPPGDRGQNFDAAIQNDAVQSATPEESFVEKNFTFLVSLAALLAGFLFVLYYKRKTF